jgi:hypothetical protein
MWSYHRDISNVEGQVSSENGGFPSSRGQSKCSATEPGSQSKAGGFGPDSFPQRRNAVAVRTQDSQSLFSAF